MKRFARLFAALDATTRTSEKTAALADYFREAPEEDRLWTIALLSGRRPKRAVNTTELAQWAAEFCGDEPSWIRAYNAYIAQIGPEAFRSILAQFVGEVGAGEDGKRRGAVLVAKVKKAIAEKRKAVSP